MRTKKVNRYWCDFCNKAGLAAKSMRTHEAHCTLNPARDCRVCGLLGGSTKVGAERMAELVALLPDATAYNADWTNEAHLALHEALKTAMPTLREETEGCPACIMAALRQAKIPVPMAEDFNFSTEMKLVLESNKRQYFDEY